MGRGVAEVRGGVAPDPVQMARGRVRLSTRAPSAIGSNAEAGPAVACFQAQSSLFELIHGMPRTAGDGP